MKKFGALLLAVLSVALFAPQAQAQGVTYGLKAGFNYASATLKTVLTDTPDLKYQIGAVEGIFVNFKLGPVTIQPELLYSQRGTKWTEEEEPGVGVVTCHMRISYVELPVLVKYNFLSGPVRPFVLAGPSLGYLLSAKWQYCVHYYTDDGLDNSYEYDMKDQLKKMEFAGVFGIGADYHLAKVVLSLEARYHLGLTNVIKNIEESDVTSAKHKGFAVLVGLGF